MAKEEKRKAFVDEQLHRQWLYVFLFWFFFVFVFGFFFVLFLVFFLFVFFFLVLFNLKLTSLFSPCCSESTDELRHLDSRDIQEHVIAGRQQQMEEKKEIKAREVEEQKYFENLLEQEKQAKLERGISFSPNFSFFLFLFCIVLELGR